MTDYLTYCYKHPDRETGVSCQRCDRYICPECSTPGAVGYLCPEDAGVKSTVVKANFQKTLIQLMPLTLALMAINIVVFALQMLDSTLTDALLYAKYPGYSTLERALTSSFAHSTQDLLHILFNMWSLFIIGRILEPILGKLKFIILYFISLFGGILGVLFLAAPMTSVVGASGAIFGLMAALVIVLRAMKADARQLMLLVGINFFLSFSPGIAWQAHVGGFIAGGLVALVYVKFRKPNEKSTLYILVAVIAVALAGLWIYGNNLLPYAIN